MARSVRYHLLFDSDVLEAADWYDNRSMGLGTAFVNEARRITEAVIRSPELYGLTPTGLRFARLNRFPYLVLFDFSDEELLLLGVLHGARSIEAWQQTRK